MDPGALVFLCMEKGMKDRKQGKGWTLPCIECL